MSMWRYAILQEEDLWKVAEEYLDDKGNRAGYCEAQASSTESAEGLVDVLKAMLSDVQQAVVEQRLIKPGDPNPLFEEEVDWDALLEQAMEWD